MPTGLSLSWTTFKTGSGGWLVSSIELTPLIKGGETVGETNMWATSTNIVVRQTITFNTFF
jgi:hypothetical protein